MAYIKSDIQRKPKQSRDSMAKTIWKKWLAKLLANTYMVKPLVVFLKNIKVRSREETVKKMVEWGQKKIKIIKIG